jgi:hypothetical protein
MWRALNAFVGFYSIHRKPHPDGRVGSLTVRQAGKSLKVAYVDDGRSGDDAPGIVRGTITLSKRFRHSGRGTYVQRLAELATRVGNMGGRAPRAVDGFGHDSLCAP